MRGSAGTARRVATDAERVLERDSGSAGTSSSAGRWEQLERGSKLDPEPMRRQDPAGHGEDGSGSGRPPSCTSDRQRRPAGHDDRAAHPQGRLDRRLVLRRPAGRRPARATATRAPRRYRPAAGARTRSTARARRRRARAIASSRLAPGDVRQANGSRGRLGARRRPGAAARPRPPRASALPSPRGRGARSRTPARRCRGHEAPAATGSRAAATTLVAGAGTMNE